jgi:hypothetical protein
MTDLTPAEGKDDYREQVKKRVEAEQTESPAPDSSSSEKKDTERLSRWQIQEALFANELGDGM